MSNKLRFEEIKDQIKELLDEAIDLVPEGGVKERARAYWYPHIIMALDSDHEYMGGSICTMEDTANEFDEEEDYDEEDDEDKSLSFNTQEEYDDYSASNPPRRSYCLECGDDYEWFMHNCTASAFNEVYGCSKCDDHCAFCND